jgi:aminoglycoside 6-adenylyltransferase
VGVKTQFRHSPGKEGKYLKHYLEPALWVLLEQTYADANYDHTWDALGAMCMLFRTTACTVAAPFGFAYPQDDDDKVSAHLNHVRALPKHATEMY